jgi:hypothetical protein
MWKGELRSHFANFAPVNPTAMQEPLVRRIILPPPPTPDQQQSLAQATRDSLHTGITIHSSGTPERWHPSFVDDTGVAHIRPHFLTAAAASVHAAYVMFGHPDPDEDPNRPPCINPTTSIYRATHGELRF